MFTFTVALLCASPLASRTAGANTTGSPGPLLVFQALRCGAWSSVPGNSPVEPSLDTTDGRWRSWGPHIPGDVVAYHDETLPRDCEFVDGVGFRVTAVANGLPLVVGQPGYVPVGREDGVSTVHVGYSGASGSGELSLSAGQLGSALRAGLVSTSAGGGLWVSADVDRSRGELANLRCHRDARNSDNREVLRPNVVDRVVVCVAYVVGPRSGGENPAPTTTTTTRVVPTPTPTPTPAPSTTTATTSPPAPSTTASAPPNSTTVPTGPSATQPAVPSPAPTSPSTPSISAPSVPPPAASPGSAPASSGSPGTPAVAGPATTAPPLTTARPDELAAPLPVEARRDGVERALGVRHIGVIVEVGGVTRGTPPGRLGGAPSLWTRDAIVELHCDDLEPIELRISAGQVPGYQVKSDLVRLPEGSSPSCTVRPIDAGVDEANIELVSILVDGQSVSIGRGLRFYPQVGDEEVRVSLTYGQAAAHAMVERPFSGQRLQSDHDVPLPLALGLAATFVVGMAGAVVVSRRGV